MLQPASPRAAPVSINRYLLPYERQVAVVRQHPAVLIAPAAVALAGLITAAVLSITGIDGKENLAPIMWVGWLLLLLYLISRVASWSVSYFVVTSQRMLLATGFVARRISQIPLATINDIQLDNSRVGLRLGFGDFTIRTGGQKQVAQRIQYLPLPQHLLETIDSLLYPGGPPASLDQ